MERVDPFIFSGLPARVVFGGGTLARLGDEIAALGLQRVLLVATPGRGAWAREVAAALGAVSAGIFDGAAMHTPVGVTAQAVEVFGASGADGVVALGGGSTVGLGKAIAARTGASQIAVPTTYAGSEMTDILGETEDGRKTTRRSAGLRPKTVIYDVDLTMGLPAHLTAVSGMNALAHAVEALYAPDRNPVIGLMAGDAATALGAALPALADDPRQRAARERALYGAWLAGAALGGTTMGLHHRICHVLGGSFGLPHAETHAVVLPHAAAFNATAAGDLMAPVAAALGGGPVGAGLQALARRIGAPTALRDLGLDEGDLDRAAALATETPCANPRPVDRAAVRGLLGAAWAGMEPMA